MKRLGRYGISLLLVLTLSVAPVASAAQRSEYGWGFTPISKILRVLHKFFGINPLDEEQLVPPKP